MNMTPAARIAVVEDDADLLHITQEYLSLAGFSVWGVGSAETFIRRFVADPVDFVVLDLGLPGEDGLSVAELLQKNRQVAVIIVSARDSLEERLAGMGAGADRYLVKPVNLVELKANIDAVIGKLQLPLAPPAPELPQQTPEPDAGAWRLDTHSWQLAAPGGQQLKLTAHEFAFMRSLTQAQGRTVSKSELTDAIFGQRIGNATERLNVLVTRLRKKVHHQLGESLPIETVRQVGYTFTAPAELF